MEDNVLDPKVDLFLRGLPQHRRERLLNFLSAQGQEIPEPSYTTDEDPEFFKLPVEQKERIINYRNTGEWKPKAGVFSDLPLNTGSIGLTEEEARTVPFLPGINSRQDYLDARAKNQSNWSYWGNFGKRLLFQSAGKFTENIGHILGAGAGALTADFDKVTNNALVTIGEDLDQWAKDISPMYGEYTSWYKDKTALEKMFSPTWWGTSGVDALSFVASAYGTGFGAGALARGVGNIAAKALGAGSRSQLWKQFNKSLMSSDKLGAEAATRGLPIKSLGNKFDVWNSMALNTAGEAGFEAKHVQEEIQAQLQGKTNPDTGVMYTQEEINQISNEAAAGTFANNLWMLILPNYIESTVFFKSFKGTRSALSKLTPADKAKIVATKTALGFGVEGPWEENIQLATSDYYTNRALGTDKREAVEGISQNWIRNFSTPEGQENILAGGVIGAPIGAAWGLKKEIAENTRGAALRKIMDEDIINYRYPIKNFYKYKENGELDLDDRGKPQADPVKVKEFEKEYKGGQMYQLLEKAAIRTGNYEVFKSMRDMKLAMGLINTLANGGDVELSREYLRRVSEADAQDLQKVRDFNPDGSPVTAQQLFNHYSQILTEATKVWENIDSRQAGLLQLPGGNIKEAGEFINRLKVTQYREGVRQSILKNQAVSVQQQIDAIETRNLEAVEGLDKETHAYLSQVREGIKADLQKSYEEFKLLTDDKAQIEAFEEERKETKTAEEKKEKEPKPTETTTKKEPSFNGYVRNLGTNEEIRHIKTNNPQTPEESYDVMVENQETGEWEPKTLPKFIDGKQVYKKVGASGRIEGDALQEEIWSGGLFRFPHFQTKQERDKLKKVIEDAIKAKKDLKSTFRFRITPKGAVVGIGAKENTVSRRHDEALTKMGGVKRVGLISRQEAFDILIDIKEGKKWSDKPIASIPHANKYVFMPSQDELSHLKRTESTDDETFYPTKEQLKLFKSVDFSSLSEQEFDELFLPLFKAKEAGTTATLEELRRDQKSLTEFTSAVASWYNGLTKVQKTKNPELPSSFVSTLFSAPLARGPEMYLNSPEFAGVFDIGGKGPVIYDASTGELIGPAKSEGQKALDSGVVPPHSGGLSTFTGFFILANSPIGPQWVTISPKQLVPSDLESVVKAVNEAAAEVKEWGTRTNVPAEIIEAIESKLTRMFHVGVKGFRFAFKVITPRDFTDEKGTKLLNNALAFTATSNTDLTEDQKKDIKANLPRAQVVFRGELSSPRDFVNLLNDSLSQTIGTTLNSANFMRNPEKAFNKEDKENPIKLEEWETMVLPSIIQSGSVDLKLNYHVPSIIASKRKKKTTPPSVVIEQEEGTDGGVSLSVEEFLGTAAGVITSERTFAEKLLGKEELKGKVTSTESLEAKKADIERRRQEELNSLFNTQTISGEIVEDIKKDIKELQENPKSAKEVIEDLEDQYFEALNEQDYTQADYLKVEIDYLKNKPEDIDEGLDQLSSWIKTRDTADIELLINAKYDAELAALGEIDYEVLAETQSIELREPKEVNLGPITLKHEINKYGATENTITNNATGEAVVELITKDGDRHLSPVTGKDFISSVHRFTGKSDDEIFAIIFRGIPVKELINRYLKGIEASKNLQAEINKVNALIEKAAIEAGKSGDWGSHAELTKRRGALMNKLAENAPPEEFKLDVGIDHLPTISLQDAEKELREILPSEFTTADIRTIINNLSVSSVPAGVLVDKTIYLHQSVKTGVHWHEAFHVVFRHLLDNAAINKYLGIAKVKYGIPSDADIQEFRKIDIKYLQLTNLQLRELILEEKLADEFMQWKNNHDARVTGGFRALFNKIWTWIKGVFGAQNQLEELFVNISSGRFKDSAQIQNKFSLAGPRAVYKLLKDKGVDESNQIIYTVAGLYIEARESGNRLSFSQILDMLADNQLMSNPINAEIESGLEPHRQEEFRDSLDREYIFYTNDTVRKQIQIAASQITKEATYRPSNPFEELDEDLGSIAYDKDPTQDNLWDTASQRIKAFFGTVLYDAVDSFGRTQYLDSFHNRRPLKSAVNASGAYNSILHSIVDRDMKDFLPIIKEKGLGDAQLAAVYGKLAQYEEKALAGNYSAQQFLQHFKINMRANRRYYTNANINREKGEVRIFDGLTEGVDKWVLKQWRKKYIGVPDKKLVGKLFKEALVFALRNKASGNISVNASEEVKKAFSSVGIELSTQYAKVISGEAAVPKVFKNFFVPTIDDINILSKQISEGKNLFVKKSITHKLAKSNAHYDSSLFMENFTDGEGKRRFGVTGQVNFLERMKQLEEWLPSPEDVAEFKSVKTFEGFYGYLPIFNSNTDAEVSAIFRYGNIQPSDVGYDRLVSEITPEGEESFDAAYAGNNFKTIDRTILIADMLNHALNHTGMQEFPLLTLSRYYAPLPSAGRTQLSVSLPWNNKYFTNGKITQKFIDLVYNTIFLQEYETLKDKFGRVVMNKSFLQIDSFNTSDIDKSLGIERDEDGKVKKVGAISNPALIKTAIEQHFNKEIAELKKLANESRVQEGFLDKEKLDLEGGFDAFIGNFALNNFLAKHTIAQLSRSELSSFKNLQDVNKRGKVVNISGLDTPPYRLAYIADSDEVNGTFASDSQSYGHIDYLIKTLDYWGEVQTEERKELLEKFKNPPIDEVTGLSWEPSETELGEFDFISKKFTTAGFDSNSLPVYHKHTVAWLSKRLVAHWNTQSRAWEAKPGFEWHFSLMNLMEEKGIDQITTLSASKMTSLKPINMEDVMAGKDTEVQTRLIPGMFQREQLRLATKDNPMARLAVQMQQLVDYGADSLDPEVQTLRDNLLKDLAKIHQTNFDFLEKMFGDPENLSNALFHLRENSQVGGLENNYWELFQEISGKPKYNFSLPHLRGKAQDLMFAMFREATYLKIRGNALVMMSPANIRVVRDRSGEVIPMEELLKNKEAYADNERTTLRMSFDEAGKPYAEIMTTARVAKAIGMDIGKVIELSPDKLEVLGVRIPYEGNNSGISAKIVQFLPDEYGDVGIFPPEFYNRSGADNDADTVYTYSHDYYQPTVFDTKEATNLDMIEAILFNKPLRKGPQVKYGTAVTAEEKWTEFWYYQLQRNSYIKDALRDILSKFDGRATEGQRELSIELVFRKYGLPSTLQEFVAAGMPESVGAMNNRLLDTMQELFRRPEMAQIATIPASSDALKIHIAAAEEFVPVDRRKFSPDGTVAYIKGWEDIRAGKNNISIIVNSIGNNAYLTKHKINIAEDYQFTIDGKRYSTFGSTLQELISKITDMKSNETAATDAEKEPIMQKAGMYFQLVPVFTTLEALNVPGELVVKLHRIKNIEEIGKSLDNNDSPLTKRRKSRKGELSKALKAVEEWLKKANVNYTLDQYSRYTLTTAELNNVLKLSHRPANERSQEENLIFNIGLRKILELYSKASIVAQEVTDAGRVGRLGRFQIDSFAKFDSTVELFNRPYEALIGIWDVWGKDPLVTADIEIYQKINRITSNLFLDRTKLINEAFYDVRAMLSPYLEQEKVEQVRTLFTTYLILKKHEETSGTVLNSLNRLIRPELNLEGSLTHREKFLELIGSSPEFGDNPIVQFLTEETNDKTGLHSVNADSFIKLTPELDNLYKDAFARLLRSKNQEIKDWAYDFVNYEVVKNNLNYKNDSVLRFIPPQILLPYFQAADSMMIDLRQGKWPLQTNSRSLVWDFNNLFAKDKSNWWQLTDFQAFQKNFNISKRGSEVIVSPKTPEAIASKIYYPDFVYEVKETEDSTTRTLYSRSHVGDPRTATYVNVTNKGYTLRGQLQFHMTMPSLEQMLEGIKTKKKEIPQANSAIDEENFNAPFTSGYEEGVEVDLNEYITGAVTTPISVEVPFVPVPVDITKANISEAQKKYSAKDNYKSTNSNKFIGRGNGATGEYLRLSKEAEKPSNSGTYSAIDVVFISANGKRGGRISPDFTEIQKAVDAGASFLTDAKQRRPEGGNAYNIGEQEIADFLRKQGYTEAEEFGGMVARWTKATNKLPFKPLDEVEGTNIYEVEVFKEIFNGFQVPITNREVIDRILRAGYLSDEKDIKLAKVLQGKYGITKFGKLSKDSAYMEYDAVGGNVRLDVDTLSNEFSKENFALSYLHEVLHHYTYRAFFSTEKTDAIFKQDMTKLFLEAKRLFPADVDTSKGTFYGLKEPWEFVSEILTNKAFVEKLKGVNKQTLWQKIVNALRRFFKYPVTREGKQIYKDSVSKIIEYVHVVQNRPETGTPHYIPKDVKGYMGVVQKPLDEEFEETPGEDAGPIAEGEDIFEREVTSRSPEAQVMYEHLRKKLLERQMVLGNISSSDIPLLEETQKRINLIKANLRRLEKRQSLSDILDLGLAEIKNILTQLSVEDIDKITQQDIAHAYYFIPAYQDIREVLTDFPVTKEDISAMAEISKQADAAYVLYKKARERRAFEAINRFAVDSDQLETFGLPTADIGAAKREWLSEGESHILYQRISQRIIEDLRFTVNLGAYTFDDLIKTFEKEYSKEDLDKVAPIFNGVRKPLSMFKYAYEEEEKTKIKETQEAFEILRKKYPDKIPYNEKFSVIIKLAEWFKENNDYSYPEEHLQQYRKDEKRYKDSLETDAKGKLTPDSETALTTWIEQHDPIRYMEYTNKKEGAYNIGNKFGYKYLLATPKEKWSNLAEYERVLYPNGKKDERLWKLYYFIINSLVDTVQRGPHGVAIEVKDYKRFLSTIAFKDTSDTGLIEGLKQTLIDLRDGSKTLFHDNLTDLDLTGKSAEIIDPRTGDVIPAIRMPKFTHTSEESKDFWGALSAYYRAGLLYQYRVETYPIQQLLLQSLEDLPEIKYTKGGKPKEDLTGNSSSKGMRNAIAQMKFAIGAEYFDKTKSEEGSNKARDKALKIHNKWKEDVAIAIAEGKTVPTMPEIRVFSGVKTMDTLLNYTRLKMLSLNPFSGLGNILIGLASNAVYAARGTHFNDRDYLWSFKLLFQAMLNYWSHGNASKLFPDITKTALFMRLFNVMDTRQWEIKDILRGKLMEKLMTFQSSGEYINQGQLMLSMLHHIKIKDKKGNDKTLWDAYKLEENKLVWDSTNFEEMPEWQKYEVYDKKTKKNKSQLRQFYSDLIKVRKATQGDYQNAMKAKSTVFNRVISIFRQWLPQAIYQRFGRATGTDFKGRFRTWADMWGDVGALETVGRTVRDALLLGGLPGFGRLGGNWFVGGTQERMLKKGLSKLDLENYRANLRDIQFIAVITMLMLGLKAMGDDDDNVPKELLYYAFNQTQRFHQELTFFMYPPNAVQIVRDFIPLYKTVTDLGEIVPAAWTYVFDHENDVYQRGFREGKSKLGRTISQNVPVWRAINLSSSIMSQAYGSKTYQQR